VRQRALAVGLLSKNPPTRLLIQAECSVVNDNNDNKEHMWMKKLLVIRRAQLYIIYILAYFFVSPHITPMRTVRTRWGPHMTPQNNTSSVGRSA
jgi:hypothetical protein